jgi:hypothetical protein
MLLCFQTSFFTEIREVVRQEDLIRFDRLIFGRRGNLFDLLVLNTSDHGQHHRDHQQQQQQQQHLLPPPPSSIRARNPRNHNKPLVNVVSIKHRTILRFWKLLDANGRGIK